MGLRSIRNNHFMTSVGMLEKIIDSFLFHQSAGEIEIGLPVLNAVFPVFVLAAKLEVSIES